MHILIFGRGQLSQDLQQHLLKHQLSVLSKEECDITKKEQVQLQLAQIKPDLIINAAAFTAVDLAEKAQKKAFAVNGIAPGYIAEISGLMNIPLIHISTDYVFEGLNKSPYEVEEKTAPLSVYGKSKRQGELAVSSKNRQSIIVRTSWLYGAYGKNFVKNIILARKGRNKLGIVNDQIGSPTSTASLASFISLAIEMISSGFDCWGIYHYANEGQCSWYDFTREIFRLIELEKGVRAPRIEAISTKSLRLTAPRPHYSVLSCSKTRAVFKVTPPNWACELAQQLPSILNSLEPRA